MPIIALLIFFLPFSLQAQPLCAQVFKSERGAFIEPFTSPKASIQSGEISSVGQLVNSKNSREQVEKILEREGTYPLFITSEGAMMVSHRLPEAQKNQSKEEFLATHRGLYHRYLEVKGEKPSILFSGELRVVAGRAMSLIDQSKTFHESHGNYKGGLSLEGLIEKNQVRLDFAVKVLEKWGLVGQQTVVRNFWDTFKGYSKEERHDGHMSARRVSQFEMKCRQSSSCWKKVKRLQAVISRIADQGGDQVFIRSIRELPAEKWFTEISLLSSMLREGVIDVMARPHIYENPHFKSLIRELDLIEEALLAS